MGVFQQTTEIYRNEDVLRDDYRPESIAERDHQLDEYKAALQPVINGNQPRNIFLYGKTGVGKTVVTKYLLDHLETDAKQYDNVSIRPVYLNCKSLTSSYQVAVELVNEFRDEANEISPTGNPANVVYNLLWEELEAIGGTILIVLDEIDSIGTNDDLLYQIPRARSNDNLTDAKVGLIGITNDLRFREKLDARVRDTLWSQEINFPPYNATELQNILSDRAELAFHNDKLSDDVVPLCSALAAKDRGSARQALDLLYEAGNLARKDGDTRVEESHVYAAQDRLERRELEESMKELTDHGHLTLLAVVSLTVNEEATPARKQVIYDRYTQLVENLHDHEPLKPRSVHDHLGELVLLGILDRHERNEGRSGGAYYEYELGVTLETAFKTLTALEIASAFDLSELQRVATTKDLL